jgi:hypothetical protein
MGSLERVRRMEDQPRRKSAARKRSSRPDAGPWGLVLKEIRKLGRKIDASLSDELEDDDEEEEPQPPARRARAAPARKKPPADDPEDDEPEADDEAKAGFMDW